MQGAPPQWESWRRTVDYYDEDVLNWLWVDTIIREQTHGQKSMDDFCHLFHGGQSGPPEVKTYTFDDVVNTLNQVAPYDWRGFWTERLTNHGPGAPLTGIEQSGWKLVYDETPSELAKVRKRELKEVNAEYSIGLLLDESGHIIDTVEGMPAAKAGIANATTRAAAVISFIVIGSLLLGGALQRAIPCLVPLEATHRPACWCFGGSMKD